MTKFIWTAATVFVMFLIFHVYAEAQQIVPQWELIGKSDQGEFVYTDLKSKQTIKEPKYSSAWFRFVKDDEDIQIRFYSTFENKAVCYDLIRLNGKLIPVTEKTCFLVQKNTIGEEIFRVLIVFYIVSNE
ncbi:MAG TPA: hypothetical protein P5293_08785 [Bacteroidales bacterium]|nr:hypothetical protein [Bacteroidales bacterium]